MTYLFLFSYTSSGYVMMWKVHEPVFPGVEGITPRITLVFKRMNLNVKPS